MAKRKRRREKSKNAELTVEIYAVILVLISILGIGKLGPFGKMISSFAIFLTGSVYMVFLLLLFIIGVYAFIKKDWPDFFSTKLFGFYLFSF